MSPLKSTSPCSYGHWPSPITPGGVSRKNALIELGWDGSGQTLIWLEGRSDRTALVARTGSSAPRDLTATLNIRGGVGYGGGEFTVAGDTIFFCERSGALLRCALTGGQPTVLTPPDGGVASPTLSPDRQWLACVHTDGENDWLVLVDAEGRTAPVAWVHGADFYMQPLWSPAGDTLAWVEWNRPDMPWLSTRLMLAHLQGTPPQIVRVELIDGGKDLPAVQPRFSPDGRTLAYIRSQGEWDQLMLLDLATGRRRVLVGGENIVLALPAWVQGGRSFGWNADGSKIYFTNYFQSKAHLGWVDVPEGKIHSIDLAPYTWVSQLTVNPVRDELAFLGEAADIPDQVVRWDGSRFHVEARSEPQTISPAYFSHPRTIHWTAPDGETVHGLFYPPTHPDCHPTGLPPAVVHVHSGPTSAAADTYESDIQFFTSRGYAWLEVNYRGSTGFGRSYQNALHENWGEVDVEDAAGAARALAEQGLADAHRLAISGSSAGGFTVLNTLIRYPGLFKAGICAYGVANLAELDRTTHKFERDYNTWLVGPLPEAAQRYKDRSPVFQVDRIRDPLAIFQGSADPVVSPAQSESIAAQLRQNGVPHIYVIYEGEGHRFRKAETVLDYFQKMETFLQTYLDPAPGQDELP